MCVARDGKGEFCYPPGMAVESRQELHARQTAEQYEQIGRFVVEFERICAAIRLGIVFALQRDGLRNQSLAQVLINNKFMSALPLRDAHDAIMTETGARDDPIQKEVLDQASGEFHDLINVRNEIVHGHWMIGWASTDDPDFSEIGGSKGNPSKKKGMQYTRLPKSVEEISDLVERASSVGRLLSVIHSLLMLQASGTAEYKFENNLTKVDGKWTTERDCRF